MWLDVAGGCLLLLGDTGVRVDVSVGVVLSISRCAAEVLSDVRLRVSQVGLVQCREAKLVEFGSGGVVGVGAEQSLDRGGDAGCVHATHPERAGQLSGDLHPDGCGVGCLDVEDGLHLRQEERAALVRLADVELVVHRQCLLDDEAGEPVQFDTLVEGFELARGVVVLGGEHAKEEAAARSKSVGDHAAGTGGLLLDDPRLHSVAKVEHAGRAQCLPQSFRAIDEAFVDRGPEAVRQAVGVPEEHVARSPQP